MYFLMSLVGQARGAGHALPFGDGAWRCARRHLAPSAQETVNYASVSGRVTDPQGAVVPGAQVIARQTDTNVDRGRPSPTPKGASGSRILSWPVRDQRAQLQGFADATRRLKLTVGSAFELPIALARRGRRRRASPSPPTPRCSKRRAARSPGRSRRPRSHSLPLNGRNFLDLALLGARRLADQRRRHAALRRNVGGARARASRSAASATSRTTSSSTACRPTTMPPA